MEELVMRSCPPDAHPPGDHSGPCSASEGRLDVIAGPLLMVDIKVAPYLLPVSRELCKAVLASITHCTLRGRDCTSQLHLLAEHGTHLTSLRLMDHQFTPCQDHHRLHHHQDRGQGSQVMQHQGRAVEPLLRLTCLSGLQLSGTTGLLHLLPHLTSLAALTSLALVNLNLNLDLNLDNRHSQSLIRSTFNQLLDLSHLNLTHTGLYHLPTFLLEPPRLQRLVVAGTRLEEIPAGVLPALTHLTLLDVHDNRLRRLPDSLSSLTDLKVLQVHRNHLDQLPTAVSLLTQLHHLDLSRNYFKSFPAVIKHLNQLEHLGNVHNNRGRSVTGGVLAALTHITYLDFQYNGIAFIPNEVSQMKQLKHLALGDNRLKLFPQWLGHLRRLQYLDLSCTGLNVPEDLLGDLSQLLHLNLSVNQLLTLPDCIGRLRHLQHLDVSYNKLERLPASLLGCVALRFLDISRAGSLNIEGLAEVVSTLTALEKLRVSATRYHQEQLRHLGPVVEWERGSMR